MTRFYARFAGTLLALACTLGYAVPVRADQPAATGATQSQFATAITPVYGSKYPIAGHLDLEITASGIVRGYYHNAYQKTFIQVNGGRDGNYIWFDIGPSNVDLGIGAEPDGRVHIIGTVDANGVIHGQLFPNYRDGVASGTAALPLQADSPNVNDQYIFVATPEVKTEATPSAS